MPTYVYRHRRTGELREVVQSIHEPLYDVLGGFHDGRPMPVNHDPGQNPEFWDRVITAPQFAVKNGAAALDHDGPTRADRRRRERLGGAVHFKGDALPISRALPRRPVTGPGAGTIDTLHGQTVRRYPDGGYADLQGRPIVDGAAARNREAKRTGFDAKEDP